MKTPQDVDHAFKLGRWLDKYVVVFKDGRRVTVEAGSVNEAIALACEEKPAEAGEFNK